MSTLYINPLSPISKKKVADHDEDGEHGAGMKLAQLLVSMKAIDVVVVVTRWYGGVHLGPDRFRIINNAARALLSEAGFGVTDTKKTKKKSIN